MTFRACSTIAAALIALTPLSFAGQANAQSSTAFSQLEGSWRGAGRVSYRDGSNQRISCRGYYTMKGSTTLGLAIRCAAQDNKIELRASVNGEGRRLSGTWEERTFNATGNIAGSATPGQLKMSISGSISGSMKISYSGTSQNVAISTSTTELKSIAIRMRR